MSSASPTSPRSRHPVESPTARLLRKLEGCLKHSRQRVGATKSPRHWLSLPHPHLPLLCQVSSLLKSACLAHTCVSRWRKNLFRDFGTKECYWVWFQGFSVFMQLTRRWGLKWTSLQPKSFQRHMLSMLAADKTCQILTIKGGRNRGVSRWQPQALPINGPIFHWWKFRRSTTNRSGNATEVILFSFLGNIFFASFTHSRSRSFWEFNMVQYGTYYVFTRLLVSLEGHHWIVK